MSTSAQDLTSQREGLQRLGVAPERVYVDQGLTGTNRERPGLREAMAACRAGDALVVTKLDRLARSLPDARDILAELTTRGVRLDLGGAVHDPSDPVGRLLFNALAMVAEFESDLIKMRTREGLAVAKAKGRLRGKQPKLTPRQEAHLVALHAAGEHSPAELAELFSVGRSTVYRAVERARSKSAVTEGAGPEGALTAVPAPASTPAESQLAALTGPSPATGTVVAAASGRGLLEELSWPAGYAPPCPACSRPTTGLAEQQARVRGVREPVVVALARPCGCPVDEHVAALQAAAPMPAATATATLLGSR